MVLIGLLHRLCIYYHSQVSLQKKETRFITESGLQLINFIRKVVEKLRRHQC